MLAGGSTPMATYRRLAASDQNWKRWSLYYGDERCVPADDPQRNSWAVIATGLPEKTGKHFPIPAELGARGRGHRIWARMPAMPFDMVLLGMGKTGIPRGLFPGQDWPDKTVFAVKNAPAAGRTGDPGHQCAAELSFDAYPRHRRTQDSRGATVADPASNCRWRGSAISDKHGS